MGETRCSVAVSWGVKNLMGCTRKVELKGSCMALGGVGNNFEKKVPFRSTENEDIDSLKL